MSGAKVAARATSAPDSCGARDARRSSQTRLAVVLCCCAG
jgi:hypothetical protein